MRAWGLILCTALAACSHSEVPLVVDAEAVEERIYALSAGDTHSFANPSEVRVTHADIQWSINFPARIIDGSVTWRIEREGHEDDFLVLDTKALNILSVAVGHDGEMRPAAYRLGAVDEVLGRPLEIPLEAEDDRVVIYYRTTKQSSALQWLNPVQSGSRFPFVYSQAQAINARSMVPCQDTPQVRFTYDATIRTTKRLRAVMAAESRRGFEEPGVFHFRMPQSIPSYLLAFAAGDLEFKSLGPRTGVWGLPHVLDSAANEFADTERMLAAAEDLYGPYRWGRFDLLVMPSSFPFGGMENPRLTFVTPTIIAGDRSLVDLVAHELAHAWSGNLVTNATWSDFWLNEGLTVYFERRIQEAVYGERRALMEATLGHEALLAEMAELPEEDTRLYVDLRDRDPEEGLTAVPYEKGYLFLRTLEDRVGRSDLDAFLRRWFANHAFTSRTTPDFEAALIDDLFDGDTGAAAIVGVRNWLYEPGIPAGAAVPHSPDLAACDQMAKRYSAGEVKLAQVIAAGWDSYPQWQRFFRQLPHDLSIDQIKEIEALLNSTKTRNMELHASYLTIAARANYYGAVRDIYSFLETVGRTKFLVPIYTALIESKAGRQLARGTYRRLRMRYHPLTRKRLDSLIRGR